jgi:CBS domain-containing protein
VADAVLMMEKERVTTLPVLNEQGSVTGLLSLVDVAASVMPGTASALLSEIRNSP